MCLRTPLAAAIVVAVLATTCAPGLQGPPLAPLVTATGVRFTLVSDGRSVAIAGSFNQWSTSSHPMAREGTSRWWTRVVPLPPGEHLFMYVVDGVRWVTPPLADDFVDDGFGAKNGVIVVRSAER